MTLLEITTLLVIQTSGDVVSESIHNGTSLERERERERERQMKECVDGVRRVWGRMKVTTSTSLYSVITKLSNIENNPSCLM